MRFASKATLVQQIETEHDRWVALLTSVPRSRFREAGVWGDGWSVHDLVAHLMEWQLMFLRWFSDGAAGAVPAMPAPGYKWNQLAGLNRAIWRQHRRSSSARILAGFEESYRQIRSLISRLPPEALLTPGHFSWTGKYPLTTYLAPNTCSHYRFAIKLLRRWVRDQPAPTRVTPAFAEPRRRPRRRNPGPPKQ